MPAEAENLSDIVGIVAPHESPLLDHIGDAREPATKAMHRWSDGDTERANNIQAFSAAVSVNRVEHPAGPYGDADEVDYQKQERLRELLRDLENCVINGKSIPPSAQVMVRSTMNGLVSMIQTNRISVDGPLNSDLLNDSIGQVNSEMGSHIDTILVGGTQKRKLNAFNCPPGDRYGMTSIYESDHGVCSVVMSRWVPQDSVLLLDSSRISVLPMKGRSFQYTTTTNTPEKHEGQLIGAYTLELRDERAHGIITGLEVK